MAALERQTFSVLGFKTTHEALSAEELLKEAGLDVVPVPTPRQLGSLCGIAMRLPPGQVEQALAVLSRVDIRPEAVASIEDVVRVAEG